METVLDARPHRREGAGGDGVLTDAHYLLVFDGDCGFCRGSATRVLERAGRLLSLPILRGIARIACRWIADHRSFVSRMTGSCRSRTLDV